MERGGYIYILTNKSNNVLYTGVTSNLYNRIYEHKHKIHSQSFTARYNSNKLVYYEFLDTIELAIAREKHIKNGSRRKKLDLIVLKNQCGWIYMMDWPLNYEIASLLPAFPTF